MQQLRRATPLRRAPLLTSSPQEGHSVAAAMNSANWWPLRFSRHEDLYQAGAVGCGHTVSLGVVVPKQLSWLRQEALQAAH